MWEIFLILEGFSYEQVTEAYQYHCLYLKNPDELKLYYDSETDCYVFRKFYADAKPN